MHKYKSSIGFNDFNIQTGHAIEKAVWNALKSIERKSGIKILARDNMTFQQSESIDAAITKINNIVTKIAFRVVHKSRA